MKTISQLFELVATATEQNSKSSLDTHQWFINYHGHINELEITFYLTGWSMDAIGDKCRVKLIDSGVQEAYWFMINKMNK
jgi:hypothetical protein